MNLSEFTSEEWAAIQQEYETEAADVCTNCGWEVDDWEIGLRETHPGDYLTPPDTENYCPKCLQALETEKESFDKWFNKAL